MLHASPRLVRASLTPSRGCNRPTTLWKLFNLDVAEQHVAGVRLQSNEPRAGVGLAAVGSLLTKSVFCWPFRKTVKRLSLTRISNSFHCPARWRRRSRRASGWRCCRSRRSCETSGRRSGREGAPASERVDLHFETEIHRDESGVVVVDSERVRKAQEDAELSSSRQSATRA